MCGGKLVRCVAFGLLQRGRFAFSCRSLFVLLVLGLSCLSYCSTGFVSDLLLQRGDKGGLRAPLTPLPAAENAQHLRHTAACCWAAATPAVCNSNSFRNSGVRPAHRRTTARSGIRQLAKPTLCCSSAVLPLHSPAATTSCHVPVTHTYTRRRTTAQLHPLRSAFRTTAGPASCSPGLTGFT